MMFRLLCALAVVLLAGAHAWGQPWSGILDPSRAVDWSNVGIPGGIPNRTAICTTLSPGATAAQINAAIADPACQNKVVKLTAGTFALTAGITFAAHNNVTLRGAGPDQTFVSFTAGTSCGGLGATVCFPNADLNDPSNPHNTANWTAGYTKGATSITLSSVTNMRVGTLLILDQLNDGNTDPGTIWVNSVLGITANDGPGGGGRTNREQQQMVKVTSISGAGPFTVGILPGLYMPNWRSGQTPGAWWSNQSPITMSGIEDMSLDHTGTTTQTGVAFVNAYNCWVKNIRSIVLAGTGSKRSHVRYYQAAASVVRDSYLYSSASNASEAYCVEMFEGASDILAENNIVHHCTIPFQAAASASGTVIAYNYSFDDWYTSATWMQGSSYHHAAGVNFVLHEGNEGTGLMADNVHGPANFITAFRNQWTGWEPGKNQQTVPAHIYTFNRYFNLIGNVLGRGGYHTQYQSQAGGSSANCDTSIFALGWGGNCSSGSAPPNDTFVATSLMRWGNYDVVSGIQFNSGEVPSGLSIYANPVPGSQVLPASFYLAAKPNTWWGPVLGAPEPLWPPIGPDVGGGDATSGSSSLGGHAYKIPARLCYENSSVDTSYPVDASGFRPKVFNATTCYTGSAAPPPPPPPSPSSPTRLFISGVLLLLAYYAVGRPHLVS